MDALNVEFTADERALIKDAVKALRENGVEPLISEASFVRRIAVLQARLIKHQYFHDSLYQELGLAETT